MEELLKFAWQETTISYLKYYYYYYYYSVYININIDRERYFFFVVQRTAHVQVTVYGCLIIVGLPII